jgi:hypothetical protein
MAKFLQKHYVLIFNKKNMKEKEKNHKNILHDFAFLKSTKN